MNQSQTRMSLRRCLQLLIVGATAVTIGGEQAWAQRPAMGPSTSGYALNGRVPATLRTAVIVMVDSVERAGLPGAPLIDKTLEGVSKGADERRILAAVRAVAAALGTASRALDGQGGQRASNEELTAGAAALRGGVAPATLSEMRRALPGRSLVVPLSVLGALVAQGAPSATAVSAVVAYAKQDDDSHLLDFSRTVAREIAAGITPQTAVAQTIAGGGPPGGQGASPAAVLFHVGGSKTPTPGNGGSGTPQTSKPKP